MTTLRRRAGLAAVGLAALTLVGIGSGVAGAQPDSAPPTPVASIPEVTGVATSVALDSGFVSALKSLDVAPGPAGSATIQDGVASFPITSGNVTVYKPGEVNPYVQGSLVHDGSGLTLTKGGTTVQLDDFIVDPGSPATLSGRVLANGEVVNPRTTLFDLDGSTLKPITTNADAGTATLTGTTVRLSEGAAGALNGAFKTDALKGGTTIGIATIVVKLPQQMGQTPSGAVSAGGGSTSGIEHAGLLGAGAVALLGAGAAAYTVRRRRTATGAATAHPNQH